MSDGLTLSHLIELVGNDNCAIEMLPERLTGAKMRKRKRGEPEVCSISFDSTIFNANDAFAWSVDTESAVARLGRPRKVGYVIWIDEDRARNAVADWKAKRLGASSGEGGAR